MDTCEITRLVVVATSSALILYATFLVLLDHYLRTKNKGNEKP